MVLLETDLDSVIYVTNFTFRIAFAVSVDICNHHVKGLVQDSQSDQKGYKILHAYGEFYLLGYNGCSPYVCHINPLS